MKPEFCDIRSQETNRKGKIMCDALNNDLLNRFLLASKRSPSKTFQTFNEADLLAIIDILIVAGVRK